MFISSIFMAFLNAFHFSKLTWCFEEECLPRHVFGAYVFEYLVSSMRNCLGRIMRCVLIEGDVSLGSGRF